MSKKVSKKNISSAMKDLEDALLNNKKNKGLNKNINKRHSYSKVKKKKCEDVLLLTDIIEISPHKHKSFKLIIMKKNIKKLVKADIKLWIKDNMHNVTNEYLKKSISSIRYNKK